MQKKHKNKDMILLAISEEPSKTVAPFVKKNEINYIVGAAASKTTQAFRIKAYPTFIVIGTNGRITYRGSAFQFAEEAVVKALKESPADASEESLEDASANAALKEALNLYKKKDYAKAMKAFEQVVKDFNGTDAATEAAAKIKSMKANKKIMAKIGEAEEKKKCERWLETARMLVKNGKRDEAAEYYQKIIDGYPESSFADIARKEMAAS